jgi:integrase
MTNIPDKVEQFSRFIQLRSLRERTREEYVRWVRRLGRHHGVACPSLCGQEEVLAFVHHLQQADKCAGSTLNQAVCAFKLFFRDFLNHAEWTCWEQIRNKRHQPLPTVLSREAVRRLLGSVHQARFQAVLSLMYHCGLRVGEACRLEVGDLKAVPGMLRVREGKGGKPRDIPIHPEMVTRLRGWWKQHRHPRWLFPGVGRGWKQKHGDQRIALRLAKQSMSESSVQAALNKAVLTARLNTPDVCCHTLRHSYATHMLEERVSLRQLQVYLGHHSLDVTARYLHLTAVSETHAQEALAQLYRQVIPPART